MNKIFIFLVTFFFLLFYLKFKFTHESLKIWKQTGHSFEIYRDNHGVPHIFSHKKQDALFALGYAEAEDRLWALMIKKFLIEGRMTELFGKEALESDLFTRNFKFHDVGKMNANALDQDTRQKAQAYCDGINYYARNCKFLPLQFYIFWLDWEDWTIQNSLGLLAFSSFSLDFQWLYQIARQRLLQTVGFQLAIQIINYGSKTLFREVTIMKEDELKQQNIWKDYDTERQIQILKQHWAQKKTALGSIHLPQFEYEGSGSNAWVIGGNHTQNGKPLLANDPHLASFAPPLFYVSEIVILDENNNSVSQIFGASMSGVPGTTIGVSQKYAWGSTSAYIDNKDFFYETVRVENNVFQYLHEGQWKNFSKKQQTYKIRWGGLQTRTAYENHRGPVIQYIFDELFYKYSYPLPLKYRINHTITCASSIYETDSTTLAALFNLTFSFDYKTLQSVRNLFNSPNIDSVFITKEGDFGYNALGRNPKRDIQEVAGVIKDGTVSDYDMKGFYEQKPSITNPKKGYIGMCNNKFAPDGYIDRTSLNEITTGRAYRLQKIITEKIKQNYKFTFEDMKKMQLDTKDEFLSEVFPLVLQKLSQTRQIWSNQKTNIYYQKLKKWDYFMEKNSVQSSLYHIWEKLLQSSFLIDTDLNQQERQAIVNHAFFQNYQFRLFEKIYNGTLGELERKVCSHQQTNNFTYIHPCEAAIALAFKKISQQAEKLFGTGDATQFHWGKIHQATFKSIPFSDIPILGKFWERKTPSQGNSRSLNVGILTHQSKGQNKYRGIAGPVFRLISDLNRTEWSLDLGNNANIFSQYYDNFLGNNKYVVYTRQNPKVKLPQNWKLNARGI